MKETPEGSQSTQKQEVAWASPIHFSRSPPGGLPWHSLRLARKQDPDCPGMNIPESHNQGMWQAMLSALEGGDRRHGCHLVGTTKEGFTEKGNFIPGPEKWVKLECVGGRGLYFQVEFPVGRTAQKSRSGGGSLESQHLGDRDRRTIIGSNPPDMQKKLLG